MLKEDKQNITMCGEEAIVTPDQVRLVSKVPVTLEISAELRQRAGASRAGLLELLRRGEHIYGVTTGFGAQGTMDISRDSLAQLQAELIRYHGAGVGEYFSEGESRAIFLTRIVSLSQGFSGVRPELLDFMLRLFNLDILPRIPQRGSVGASGDLTPLSYLAAMLCGQRECWFRGEARRTEEVFAELGIEAWRLAEKEGLALINGTAVMTALAAVALEDAAEAADLFDFISARLAESVGAAGEPFEDWVHRRKHHPGPIESARCIRETAALVDTPISRLPRSGNIQDRYSIRCAPQINGVLRDTLAMVSPWIANELNSANDNPLFSTDGDPRVYHGGNFYGGHISASCDYLRIALSTSSQLLDRQIQLMLSGYADLPENLAGTQASGVPDFGYKALGISATALASEIQQLASPVSLLSRPTENGNQDVVSMGTVSARKLRDQMILVRELVAHGLAVSRRASRAGRGAKRPDDGSWGKLGPLVDGCMADEELGSGLMKLAAAIIGP
jgi:histidine ammonia-lyase